MTDHACTPRELCAEDGDIVWRGEQGLWHRHTQTLQSNVKRVFEDAANDPVHCDLRYQGQLEDKESGLYYNLNCYYDADSGQYLSSDPIGMLGGLRPQAYVHNPMEWVDPLGLTGHGNKNKKTTYEANSRREAFRLAKRDAGIPSSQEPTISRVYLLEENEFGKKVKVLDTNGVPIEVRQYHYTNIKGEKIVIQEHSLGHNKSTPLHGDVPHFNVRPISNLETGSVDGTHGHYNF